MLKSQSNLGLQAIQPAFRKSSGVLSAVDWQISSEIIYRIKL
ncbi:hypothetical protein [Anabaena sp. CA = ATCC 33047]|nr:hypothetical protein [Anabaena sp. CA = ATCC 33047]